MTGKNCARLHLTTFLPGRANAKTQKLLHPVIKQQLPLEEVTIAERLKEAGYATACIGKWHLGGKGFGPQDQGFDFVYAGQANTKPTEDEGSKGEFDLTAAAEKFVEKNKDKPFFLYLPHNSPHIAFSERPENVEKFRDSFNPIYAAVIESLDKSVGRLLAKLDELKLADNTIVIFTSDNGGLHIPEGQNTPATHNTPFRAGKGYLYEGGLRVPLIVRWPGKIKPTVVETPVSNMDFHPTFCEFASVETPDDLDGTSIAPVLVGKEEFPERSFYWHFPHYTNQGSQPAGAMRKGRWKMIAHYATGRVELFDLEKDPSEKMDIAALHVDLTAKLHTEFEAWRKKSGVQLNVPNPDFDSKAADAIYKDFDTSSLPQADKASELAKRLRPWRELMNEAIRPKR